MEYLSKKRQEQSDAVRKAGVDAPHNHAWAKQSFEDQKEHKGEALEEETTEETELSSDLYSVKGKPNEAEASLVAPKEFMATNDSSRAQGSKDQNVKVVA